MIYIKDFFDSRGVDYNTSGKNVGTNDINIDCPWCGEGRKHLGVNTTNGKLNCWVCHFSGLEKWPSIIQLIMELDGCNFRTAIEILEKFSDGEGTEYWERQIPKRVKLPKGTKSFSGASSPIQRKALAYLKERRFGLNEIRKYNLQYCDFGFFAMRIIIPIYFNGELVTFTGRTFSPRDTQRYKHNNMNQSIMRIKDILYPWDKFSGSHLRIVEGPTDAWRLGDSALCSFGNKLTIPQRSLIAGLGLESLTLIFDSDSYGQSITEGENLSCLVPKIKIIHMRKKDVAECSKSRILEMEKDEGWFSF